MAQNLTKCQPISWGKNFPSLVAGAVVSVPFDALIEEKSHLCGIVKGEGVQKLAQGVCGLFWFFPIFSCLMVLFH